ncbi:MAG: RES domain-containing protein [Pacificimonas sp.]|jgi:RES domain-containing protein|nr:RES domain-containing protein [Pacificimonas sp.]
MRFQARCYRAHDSRWSFSPLSGAGSAVHGGRFNRKGQRALYLSLDFAAAVTEASQGFARRIPPLTLCEYDVDCEPVADLCDRAVRGELHVNETHLAAPWLSDFKAGRTPSSVRVAERLAKAGYAGLLYPSFAVGAANTSGNLVLWQWGSHRPAKVILYDPEKRLPRDQSSWPESG